MGEAYKGKKLQGHSQLHELFIKIVIGFGEQ